MQLSGLSSDLVGAIADLLPGKDLRELLRTGDAALRLRLQQGTTKLDLEIFPLETFPSWAFSLRSLRHLRVYGVDESFEVPVNPSILDFLPEEPCHSLQSIDFRFMPALRLLETTADGRTLPNMCPNLTRLVIPSNDCLPSALLKNLPSTLREFQLVSSRNLKPRPTFPPLDSLPRGLTHLDIGSHSLEIPDEGAWPPFLTTLRCGTPYATALLCALPPTLKEFQCAYTGNIPTLRASQLPPALVSLRLSSNVTHVLLDAPLPSSMRLFYVISSNPYCVGQTPGEKYLKVGKNGFESEALLEAAVVALFPPTLEELHQTFPLKNFASLFPASRIEEHINWHLNPTHLPALLQSYSGEITPQAERAFMESGVSLKKINITGGYGDTRPSADFLEFLGKSLVELFFSTGNFQIFSDEFFERKPFQNYNDGFKVLFVWLGNRETETPQNVARFWSDPLFPVSITSFTIISRGLVHQHRNDVDGFAANADWSKFTRLRFLSSLIRDPTLYLDPATGKIVEKLTGHPADEIASKRLRGLAALPPSITSLRYSTSPSTPIEVIKLLPSGLTKLHLNFTNPDENPWTDDRWLSLPPNLTSLQFAYTEFAPANERFEGYCAGDNLNVPAAQESSEELPHRAQPTRAMQVMKSYRSSATSKTLQDGSSPL